ncbi:uncharacterized protein LOC111263846 isoform X3 [Varroa jacobsoni]|uniref:uncharacterized protein LOC111263846 isoform X3 n=1 Tax=Varroa jacobsoni TaxID=62625 RepID=UPI000BFA76FA|nr:uncharacterized protein LOC111263846 isoform X3 [Varroa jacobsoni]
MSSSEDEEVVFSVEDDSTSQESDEDYQADQAIDDSINSPINLDQEPVASPRYRKDHKKPGEGFGSAQSRNLAHTQQKRPAVLRPNGSTRKPKYKKKMVLPTKHPIRHRHHIMAGGPSSPRLGRYVQLYSKNGYNLKITMNGSVEGTEEVRSDLGESILELDPVALRLYSIRGVKAKRFLCMDAKGRLIGMGSSDRFVCYICVDKHS